MFSVLILGNFINKTENCIVVVLVTEISVQKVCNKYYVALVVFAVMRKFILPRNIIPHTDSQNLQEILTLLLPLYENSNFIATI